MVAVLAALLALGDASWIMDDPETAGTSYQQSLALIDEWKTNGHRDAYQRINNLV